MDRLRLMLLLCSSFGIASATTLTGTINNPNGTGTSGYLYLSLSQQGSQATQCGQPVQVVPTVRARYQLTNGTLPGGSFIYGNDCLLPQGTYYNVQIIDNNGGTILNERWVITGATCDLGSIVSVSISGTTMVLGQPGVLLTQPTLDQTVLQPGNTFTKINNVNVTSELQMGTSLDCKLVGGCTFSQTAAFVGGLGTGPNSSSNIYIGSGNMFQRSFSGADATCSGVQDGWFGIRLDTKELQSCINGTLYKVAMH